MVYRVVIAKFYANGFRKMNNQEIKFVVSFFCCEKFIKGGIKPKSSHYDMKIV